MTFAKHLTLAGKFSIRIVPNQTPDFVEMTVRKYLEQKWEERGSTNNYSLSMDAGGRCWDSDHRHPNYEAARSATKMVYGVEPDLTREGIDRPMRSSARIPGISILFLCFRRLHSDHHHPSTNDREECFTPADGILRRRSTLPERKN